MADGFKIADGYVEVHGVVDRRSVIMAADQITRGVSDQMTTGVAFGNLREAGRKMGGVVGEHAGPSAARETTEGLASWIDQGAASGHVRTAGTRLGELLGRESGSPFVEHLLAEITRRAEAGTGGGGAGPDVGTGTLPPGDRGDGRGRYVGPGAPSGGNGGNGGRGRAGGDGGRGGAGGNAEVEGRTIGETLGKGAVAGFMSAFFEGLRSPLSMAANNPVIGTAALVIGGALGVLAAPAFGAAFSSALLLTGGLGVIGLGAWLLKDDPKVKAAATKLSNTAKKTFTDAAQPLAGPFERSLGLIEQMLVDISPQLKEMFAAIAPAIEPLTRGLIGFIKEMMPGFIDLIKAAEPFLADLENTLPRFGEHVGKFLTLIAENGPGAAAFFRDFIHVIGLILVGFGNFVSFLTGMYQASRAIFLLLVHAIQGLYWSAKVPIDLLIQAFRNWYNFWRDIFYKARRDSDGFVDFLKKLPGKVWEAVKATPDKLKSIFANAYEWLQRAGERIIGGLIRGIKNAIPGLSSVLDWVTDKIPDWKGPEDKDAKLLEPTGVTIMAGLGRGIARGAGDLRDQLGDVTASIPRAAAPASSVAMGGITINIHTSISSWREVPDEVITALDAALNRYRKAYA